MPSLRIDDRVIAAALAASVVFLGIRYATRVAGGADSYGYISQADLWAHGTVTVPQPWAEGLPWPDSPHTFAPLGYRPALDRLGIVPTYPPGLPMLMGGVKLVAGHCAMFWVTPLSGGLLVLSTFLLGRRLSSSRAGLAAAALVASSPLFLSYITQSMSDVPVSAAWALSLLLLCSPSVVSAGGAGLAAGMAVLIRPNLSPMAMLAPVWLALKVVRATDSLERRRCVRQLAAYLVGLAPGVIVLALFNWEMYGEPLRSGYGDLGGMFAWSNIVPNAKNYVVWFAQVQTVLPLAGVVALVAPGAVGWPRPTDRTFVVMLGVFVLLVFAQYCAYAVFDAWWYLRFVLPCWPLIMIGFAQIGWRMSQKSTAAATVVTLVVIALAIRGVWIGVKESSFEFWRGERRYVETAHLVRELTEGNSVILSMQHSGALRYYAGRMTMNTGWMDRGWLDRTVAWLEEHGAHPYVLLDDWEVAQFTEKFAGSKTLSQLEAPPLLAYLTSGTTRLFDLGSAPRTQSTLEVRDVPQRRARCTPPAPPPRLVLK